MSKRSIKVLTIINVVMLVISILCLIGTSINNKIINSIDREFTYRKENGKTVLELEGTEVVLQFGKDSVKVVNSYVIENKETQLQTVLFIRKYLSKQTPRQTTDLLGEFRLHNALYRLGIRRQQTGESDLDYIKDKRWYIDVVGKILGLMGI